MLSNWIALLSFFVLVAPRPVRPVCSCGSGFNSRSSVASCTRCGTRRHVRCVGNAAFVCDSCSFQELPHFVEEDAREQDRMEENEEIDIGRGERNEDGRGGNERNENRRGENEGGENGGINGNENRGEFARGGYEGGVIRTRENEGGENRRGENEGGNEGNENRRGENRRGVNHHGSIPKFKKGVNFISLNVRSLLPKMSDVKRMLQVSSASVLALSETWLDSSISDNEIAIAGYSIVRKDRDRHGGGVLMYIKENLAFNVRTDLYEEGMESVWVELLLPKSRGILVNSVYRSPRDNLFVEKLRGSLSRLDLGKEIYILGDFNIDFGSKASLLYRSYMGVVNLFNLRQIIDKPTRITDNSCTILDHILTNSVGKLVNSGVFDYGVSDHLPVFCSRLGVRALVRLSNGVGHIGIIPRRYSGGN